MANTPPLTKTASKTITDTIVGEHQHVIVGYSLVKGIGDGEPIASERFSVGGHEWVSEQLWVIPMVKNNRVHCCLLACC